MKIATMWIAGVLAVGLAAAASVPSRADALDFTATLDGSHEVPPVSTAATGSASLTVNEAQTEIAFTLSVQGIDPGAITGAHVHFGAPGVNGPVIFGLASGPFTSPLTGTLTAASLMPDASVGVNTFADAIAALIAGNMYVNVHTSAHPDGEIRGQLGQVVAGGEVEIKMRKSINPRSKGVIAVAILSTDAFNACTVDGTSILLGPAGAHPRRGGKCADVNEDGLADLHMHFKTREVGIQCGDTSVTLSGHDSGGQSFEVIQPIRTVGCKKK